MALRGVFGFCGVTDHVNMYLHVCLRYFLLSWDVCMYLWWSVSSFINLHITLIVLHCWHNHFLYLHKLHFLFCSAITHRVIAVLTLLSHLCLMLDKCLPFFSSQLHLYKLELSTKLHLCTYSATYSIQVSVATLSFPLMQFSFLVQTSR